MTARTVTITDPKKVRDGDSITLTKSGVQVTGKHRDCRSGGPHLELPAMSGGGIPTACTSGGWKFVGGTRELPAREPGERGSVLLKGRQVKGTWIEGLTGTFYFAPFVQQPESLLAVREEDVREFVPDPQDFGITPEEAIRAMRSTETADRNVLETYELRELLDAVYQAIGEAQKIKMKGTQER